MLKSPSCALNMSVTMLSTRFDSTLRTPSETLVVSVSLDEIVGTNRYSSTEQRTSYDSYNRIKNFEYFAATHLNLSAAVVYFTERIHRLYYTFQEMIDND